MPEVQTNNVPPDGGGRPMPRARHVVGLSGLLLFLGYFGVWRGYQLMAHQFGVAWGIAAALVGVLGLLVVAVVGVVVIRAMRQMEDAPPEPEDDSARQ